MLPTSTLLYATLISEGCGVERLRPLNHLSCKSIMECHRLLADFNSGHLHNLTSPYYASGFDRCIKSLHIHTASDLLLFGELNITFLSPHLTGLDLVHSPRVTLSRSSSISPCLAKVLNHLRLIYAIYSLRRVPRPQPHRPLFFIRSPPPNFAYHLQ